VCWIICHIKRQLFSHKMTSILFWNIKWLFVRFTFCRRTTVTLDRPTQWQNARTFLERINLRYTTQHNSKLSRYRFQNNCSMCPPTTIHSNYCLQSVTPLISGLFDDLMVKTIPAGAHSVFKIAHFGNWNSVHALLQSSPDSNCPGWWVAIQTVRWNSARYAAATQQLTSLDETARRTVETRNIVGLLTNVRKKTSLQQSFTVVNCIYLGSCVMLFCISRVFLRSKNVRAFCHCVSSVTVVLWQKVNLTNKHLIFQNKIGVILCENNWRLI